MKKRPKVKQKTQIKSFIVKRIIIIMLFIISLCAIVAGICAASYRGKCDKNVNRFVYDDANILSEGLEVSLDSECKNIQDKYDLNIFILSTDILTRFSQNEMANILVNKGIERQENYVVLVLKRDIGYHFDIYTYGTSASKITNKEIEDIVWGKGGDLIVDGDLYNGVVEVINELGYAYSWMKLSNTTWPILILVCGVISVIIAIIVYFVIKHKYSRNRSVENFSYYNNSSLDLTVDEDRFITKDLQVVVTETPSSSDDDSGFSDGGNDDGYRGGR